MKLGWILSMLIPKCPQIIDLKTKTSLKDYVESQGEIVFVYPKRLVAPYAHPPTTKGNNLYGGRKYKIWDTDETWLQERPPSLSTIILTIDR